MWLDIQCRSLGLKAANRAGSFSVPIKPTLSTTTSYIRYNAHQEIKPYREVAMPTHNPTAASCALFSMLSAPLLAKERELADYSSSSESLKECVSELSNSISPDSISEDVRHVKTKNDIAFQEYCRAIESLMYDEIKVSASEPAACILPTLAKLYDTAYQLKIEAEHTIANNLKLPATSRRQLKFYEEKQLLNPGSSAAFYDDQLDIFARTLPDDVKVVLANHYDCFVLPKPPSMCY
ncbi:MAG: hypothetical protein P1U34_11770 [Coxiellaceae bacterium]|nr:hypothetical protein [Coxiellaceae bacterium]